MSKKTNKFCGICSLSMSKDLNEPNVFGIFNLKTSGGYGSNFPQDMTSWKTNVCQWCLAALFSNSKGKISTSEYLVGLGSEIPTKQKSHELSCLREGRPDKLHSGWIRKDWETMRARAPWSVPLNLSEVITSKKNSKFYIESSFQFSNDHLDKKYFLATYDAITKNSNLGCVKVEYIIFPGFNINVNVLFHCQKAGVNLYEEIKKLDEVCSVINISSLKEFSENDTGNPFEMKKFESSCDKEMVEIMKPLKTKKDKIYHLGYETIAYKDNVSEPEVLFKEIESFIKTEIKPTQIYPDSDQLNFSVHEEIVNNKEQHLVVSFATYSQESEVEAEKIKRVCDKFELKNTEVGLDELMFRCYKNDK